MEKTHHDEAYNMGHRLRLGAARRVAWRGCERGGVGSAIRNLPGATLRTVVKRQRLPVDVTAQRFAVNELHYDESAATLLGNIVDCANSGMI